MSRWDNSNNLEYKGKNFGRRDLIEVMSYENAYCILEFMKYKYDVKKVRNTLGVISNLVPYFTYIHDVLNDKAFSEITEQDAEEYIYYFYNKWKMDVATQIKHLRNFYDFLLYINKTSENPFYRLASIYKDKKRKYSFLSQKQIDKLYSVLSGDLQLYFCFTLSSGATQEQIRYLKWKNIDFEKRVAVMDDKILYFNKDVRVLLENERKRRSEEGIDDSGYVFRGRIQKYYNKSTPISKSTVSNWDTEIGQYIDMPNFKHTHIRHTAIQRLLSASGSVGMTSILMNQPYLTSQAKYFINDDVNNDLLQEYKDICEI